MRSFYVVFNVKSSRKAQELQQQIASSGLQVITNTGWPRLSAAVVVPASLLNMLKGLIIEIAGPDIPAAQSLLYDMLRRNRYAIHSTTIGRETRMAEHITRRWWDDQFPAALNTEPLVKEVNAAAST